MAGDTALPYVNRKGVGESAPVRLAGAVIIASPPGLRTMIVLISAIGVTGILFLSLATFAKKETAPGWITPSTGLIRVVASRGGLADSVAIEEGQEVQAGQILASMRLSSNLQRGNSHDALSATLLAQKEAAHGRARAAISTLEAERRQVLTRLTALGDDRSEVERRIELQKERIALAKADDARAQELAAKGYLTRGELGARRAAVIEAEQQLSSLVSAVLSLERE